jgi:CO dehydrogenase maturation factor
MYIVVEPGRRSLDVARDIARMAAALGIPNTWGVANKVRTPEDLAAITEQLPNLPLAGWLPYDNRAIEADLTGRALYDLAPDLAERARAIIRTTLH